MLSRVTELRYPFTPAQSVRPLDPVINRPGFEGMGHRFLKTFLLPRT